MEEIKLLTREGNKSRYASKIIALFPEHNFYIEPFFGTGGIFFNKPLVKNNTLNDSSDFIFDFFNAIKTKDGYEQLQEEIKHTLAYNKLNKFNDTLADKVIAIIYSIFKTGSNTYCCDKINAKRNFLERMDKFKIHYLTYLENSVVMNKDAISFIKGIPSSRELISTFIYCDPPYSVSKGSLTDNRGWSIEKLEELIQVLINKESKFAISEFNDDLIIELFEKYDLQITIIAKSTGISGIKGYDKQEILATNYNVEDNSYNLFGEVF